MTSPMTLNISFLYDWWEQYFFAGHLKPEAATDSEFERVYLERKRFLFEHFGEFGLGEEHPVADGQYVSIIRRWCVDLIPYLLGVKLQSVAEGFWQPQPMTEAEIMALEPADITTLPYGEWILKRKDILVKRYGRAEIGPSVEGSVNAAFRIRGEELYYDMVANKPLVHHLLDVVTETVLMTYRFFARESKLEQVFLANCTASHIGPALYGELCLANDIRLATETRHLCNKERHVYLHHCDLPIDRFVALYQNIPHLDSLDGAHTSDIAAVKRAIPAAKFNALINPTVIRNQSPEQLRDTLQDVIGRGADNLVAVNLCSLTGIDNLKGLMASFQETSRAMGFDPVFAVDPFAEEEYGWELPKYQGPRLYHRDDHLESFIPAI